MAELSREGIGAVDSRDMLSDVLDQPAQMRDALERVRAAGIEKREYPGGLRIFGMGGSAIGGDLAAAAIGSRARAPIATLRGYEPEPWLSTGTLCLCASYSGDTEETLSAYDAAGRTGAQRVALTTGGRLGEKAREDGVPVIGVPSGFVPRAAVAYMTTSVYEVAHLAGVLPDPPEAEIEAAASLLEELVAELGPEAPHDSAAMALAGCLPGRVPVVYGAGLTAPVARRWKGQLNENAGIHSFWNELPELDHNEIMGWETAPAFGRFAAVFLADAHQHERTRRRLTLTARFIQDEGSEVHILESRGKTPLERVMSLVFLGDLVTIYLCAASDTDPSSMEAIERLKADLG